MFCSVELLDLKYFPWCFIVVLIQSPIEVIHHKILKPNAYKRGTSVYIVATINNAGISIFISISGAFFLFG